MVKNIAIFASGSGTNAENIINYFKNHPKIKVSLVLSNCKNAYVLERAKKQKVETLVFNRGIFYDTNDIIEILQQKQIDYIVLAGFLWLIPKHFIRAFENRIINIHPALLPKYGGKGMYGMNVHKAVIANKEKQSGISIHYVNEHYDEGDIIFQATCPVNESDTPEKLAEKVHKLEYEHFPKVIEMWITSSPFSN
ncbi:MAG: phosphoribosylglycinamide formyltransferase [Bacteroidales bacterium]|nr:phosphoribosylglycinamide formyltransferase [Bacteroidales bacterium]